MATSYKAAKPGAFWTRHSNGKIVSNVNGTITVRNSRGEEWTISSQIFENEFIIADYIADGKPVNRSELIEIILNAPRTAMTVTFRKKLDEAGFVKEALAAAKELADIAISEATFKKRLRAGLEGVQRTMKGFHDRSLDEHGRLRFIDSEADGLRLVDLRTVESAIIDGVEYVVN